MREYTYLAHHGIKGMHWGVRNFQNQDGSLTPEGKIRYGIKGGLKKIAESARANGGTLKSKLSTASANAKIIGSVAGREAGRAGESLKGKLKEGSFKLRSKLGTQNAEAERLRRYVDDLKFEHAVKANLENLKRQANYKERKEAGRLYLQTMRETLSNVKLGSTERFLRRTGIRTYTPRVGYEWRDLAMSPTSIGVAGRGNFKKGASRVTEQYRNYTNAIKSGRTEQSAKIWYDIARGRY